MALYGWILNTTPSAPFFSAVLGTAGHAVIEHFHTQKTWELPKLEILDLFTKAFDVELAKLMNLDQPLPDVPAGYDSIVMAMAGKASDYVNMLDGYQRHPKNREFHCLMAEQSFTLEIPAIDDQGNPIILADGTPSPPYLFTGMLDQFGVYGDGTSSLRDIKFRDNAFRPTRDEFNLNIQITIYATALAYGNPSCGNCKPRYIKKDIFDLSPILSYDGPCAQCKAKIGTPKWPRNYAQRCELVWMHDFDLHTKNQYVETVKDKVNKVFNPATGKMRQADVPNPKFFEGYKIGDYKGPGFIRTYRDDRELDLFISDILRVCDQIRQGHFHRRPGDHCNFWCKFKEQCTNGGEIGRSDTSIERIDAMAKTEPF